jgi:recombinational DNA repair ATPase RecF
MVKYTKLHNEFQGFVKANAQDITDDYEKKLINLIITHFDEIAEAGTLQGKRAKLINHFIQKEGTSVSSFLPTFKDKLRQGTFPFEKLTSLEVEHFRGFSRKENITLDKKYTFIYGPNGSGKSSFCEALEFAMLGYINEAITRRIDVKDYIRNSFTKIGKNPILKGVTPAGDLFPVELDPTLYNFCFIEKNRIEDFGRISASTPNEKQSLLAALFGLSEFNDFVGNFTKNIDNYIDIAGRKQQELSKKSEGLKVHKENLSKAQVQLGLLEKEKEELATNSGLSVSFVQLDVHIHGDKETQGRLDKLTKLLSQETVKLITFAAVPEVNKRINHLHNIVGQSKKLLEEYESKREKVRFRALYTIVIELQKFAEDKCPVCETPTNQTFVHPYENAKSKIKELSDIARLEKEIETKESELRLLILDLVESFNTRRKACEAITYNYSGPSIRAMEINNRKKLSALINCFEAMNTKYVQNIDQSMELDVQFEKYNLHAQEEKAKKKILEEEQNKLQAFSGSVVGLKTKTESLLKNIKEWQQVIDEFNIENAGLIKEVEAEKNVRDQNKKFVEAYTNFLNRLSNYKDLLPIFHLKQLNALTLEIYNAINDGDRHFEKAINIVLPASTQDTIKITFADSNNIEHNALLVLSEGHIRCLGLAILLAKNIHVGSPIIIFDDVVNAIDDDHKGGVKRVIFSNPHLASKQVLLTTHAEQFVKELEQHLNKEDYEKLVRKLTFIADQQDRLIRIKYNTQQNYLHKIDTACNDADWSDALYNCRCCLESLAHKLWRKLSNKNYKTEFAVVIRGPNGVPDLMSVVSSMNSFIKKWVKEEEFSKMTAIFDYLLDLKSTSNIIWLYLNKGTHEEEGRPEFDHTIVKEIAEKLIEMDRLVKAA